MQRLARLMEDLGRDAAGALRLLRRSPGFTAAAVLSLALGIGANTAMFTVVHCLLLRPLPYPDPGRLVRPTRDLAMPEYQALARQAGAFTAVAGRRGPREMRVAWKERDEWIGVLSVTPGFFATLGMAPAAGGEFAPASPSRSIILGHGLWRRLMDARPDAVGAVVALDGEPYTVAGVASPALWLPERAEAFIPLLPAGGAGDLGANTQVTARLAPGVSRRSADAAAQAAAEAFRRASPQYAPAGRDLALVSYHESLAGDVRGTLVLLSAAVVLVLAIACFNLVSLLLARLAARQREMSVRLALGSSRARLARQFAVENLVLCALGGGGGLLAARWLLDAFLAVAPFELPAAGGIRMDWRVAAFAAALTVAAALFVSLLPAWSWRRLDLQATLRQARSSGAPSRMRGAAVVFQVAAATVLLAGAGLLFHSLWRLHRQPLGFDPRGLLTFRTPVEKGTSAAARERRYAEIGRRLAALPGVRGVAAASLLPLGGKNNFPAQRAGHPEQSIGGMEIRVVTADYFETMGAPLVRGRGFTRADTPESVPVVVINEALARQWWPGADPLGDRVDVGRFHGRPIMLEAVREVVGVAADTKALSLAEPARPTLFLPAGQAGWYEGGMSWVMRAGGGDLAAAVRRTVAEIAPGQRIERFQSMSQAISSATAGTRFHAAVLAAFALFALLLAVLGVYGLLAYSVARRTGEIGTRMALGASPGQVMRLVLGQGLRLVVPGIALGICGAVVLGRAMGKLLFGVSPADPLTLAAVAAALGAAGFLAGWFPARRATRVDPLAALRWE